MRKNNSDNSRNTTTDSIENEIIGVNFLLMKAMIFGYPKLISHEADKLVIILKMIVQYYLKIVASHIVSKVIWQSMYKEFTI